MLSRSPPNPHHLEQQGEPRSPCFPRPTQTDLILVFSMDPISQLSNFLQQPVAPGQPASSAAYTIHRAGGPDHAPDFDCSLAVTANANLAQTFVTTGHPSKMFAKRA